MPGLSPIQPAFHRGEISPRKRGRVDLEDFKYGLELCDNFQPTPQGSLLMRSGSEHVLEITGGDSRVRLVQLRVLSGQDYLAVFLNNLVRVYSITGAQAIPEDLEASELVENGTFDAGATGWTALTTNGGVVNFTGGSVTLGAVLPQTSAVRQTIHLNAPADLVVSLAIGARTGGSTVRVRLGTTLGGNELLDWSGAVPPAEFAIANAPAGDLFLRMDGVPYFYGNVNGSAMYLCVIAIDNISIHAPFDGTQMDIVTPWSADEVRDVQFVAETASDRIIFVHPNHAPQYLSRNANTGSWAFGPVVFTNAPAEWTGTNWPSTVEIHNGRAYYAATPAQRNRVWATESGTTDSFALHNPVVPGDAIDFKVSTKGGFRWLQGDRVLLAGSDLGEYSISGSGGGIPLNGDIQSRRESGFGSCSRVQAVDAGLSAVHVSNDRRRIRSIAYDFRTSGWESEDLTFSAEHITAGLVRELHHVFTPDGLFVALLETGLIAMGTQVPKSDVAWWRTTLTSGTVCSAACSRGDTGAFLWLAVLRGGALFLERLPLSENAVRWYLDAAAPVTSDADGAVLVSHLTGKVRVVVPDLELVGDFDVVNGAVQLGADYANTDVVVGVPYVATAITLPVEGGNPQGTSQGLAVHWSEVVLRLYNSARPLVNGERAGGGKPFGDDLDAAEELLTKDVRVAAPEGSDGGQITITQDMPFRTEVCAIFGQAEVSRVG